MGGTWQATDRNMAGDGGKIRAMSGSAARDGRRWGKHGRRRAETMQATVGKAGRWEKHGMRRQAMGETWQATGRNMAGDGQKHGS